MWCRRLILIILISSVFSEDQRIISDQEHLQVQNERPLNIDASESPPNSAPNEGHNEVQKSPNNAMPAATAAGQFMAEMIRQLDPNMDMIRSLVSSALPAMQQVRPQSNSQAQG